MADFVVSTPSDANKVYTLYFGERNAEVWWFIFCNGHQVMWGYAPTFEKAVMQGSSKLVELKDRISLPVAA
jgi:hypothetical protein